jgi:predicted TIM-barrel fold metal-dependent hydrolase
MKFIDADAHVSEPDDLWTSRMDRRFQDMAPRVVDEYEGKKGRFFIYEDMVSAENSGLRPNMERQEKEPGASQDSRRPGGWDPAERLKDMALENIAATVLYPSRCFYIFAGQNAELQAEAFRVYNDWLAEFCNYAPDRFAGVGLISLWDLEAGCKELRRTREAGLKGAAIWSTPPESLPPYSSQYYDAFWATAQELEMPVNFHLNTAGKKSMSTFKDSLPEVYTTMVMALSEVQTSLLEMTFGGVFDRFPGLQFVSVEAECSWIWPLLERADKYLASSVRRGHGFHLPLKPTEYFQRQGWATFIKDPVGLRLSQMVGLVDRICWSTDYPHPASYFPNSQKIIEQDFKGISEDDREKILRGNVSRLWNFSVAN